MRNEITEDLFLLLIVIMAVKMKQVVNTKPVRAGYEAVNRNVFLQRATCA